jgi:hypothetical protein
MLDTGARLLHAGVEVQDLVSLAQRPRELCSERIRTEIVEDDAHQW